MTPHLNVLSLSFPVRTMSTHSINLLDRELGKLIPRGNTLETRTLATTILSELRIQYLSLKALLGTSIVIENRLAQIDRTLILILSYHDQPFL